MEHAIGKNRVETLDQLRNGYGEFFVPDPSAAMTCDQLQANYDNLNNQMLFWSEEGAKLKFKFLSGDKKEAANIASIMEIQSGVIAKYEKALEKCVVNPGGGGGGGPIILPPDPTQPTAPVSAAGVMDWIKQNPLIVAAGGIGLVLLINKKRVSGSSNDMGLLVMIAAAAILVINKQKNQQALYE